MAYTDSVRAPLKIGNMVVYLYCSVMCNKKKEKSAEMYYFAGNEVGGSFFNSYSEVILKVRYAISEV